MKKSTASYIGKVLRLTGAMGVTVMLMTAGTATFTSGCRKSRLFTHIDTLQGIPAQFHFFNGFSYDSALNFSIDGKLREKVSLYHFSAYYPTSSAFNQDPTQLNGKLVAVSDPQVQTRFSGINTIQFLPATSYLVFPTYAFYDTLKSPLINTVPSLTYYPEDVETPFDGTCRVRLISLIAGTIQATSLNITPNAGAGTVLTLQETNLAGKPGNVSASYAGSQPGIKNISITMRYGNTTAKFSFLPVTLGNRNYTFFAVGDLRNYLAGLQPRPRLFLSPDGDPSGLHELELSAVSYPGNQSTTAQVTVINGAYNLPGLLSFGDITNGGIQNPGIDASFNQTAVNVSRWPIVSSGAGLEEAVHTTDTRYLTAQTRVSVITSLNPGAYKVNIVPGRGYTPIYDQFSCNLEQGLSYSICLVPDGTTAGHCSALILQNDNAPDGGQFRLRVINLMGGTSQVDVHSDSAGGAILATAVPFAQATGYISLPPGTNQHKLFVTAAGSTKPLFQTGNPVTPISMPFNGGNSGTLYLMGLLPGSPYAGNPGSFGPYVIYVSEAAINPNTAQPSLQLYF